MKNNYWLIALIISALLGFVIYQKIDKPGMINSEDSKKVWVYVEIETQMMKDTSNYFYFGQIGEEVLKTIDQNPHQEGLFQLSDIRYWNSEDQLEIYEDENRNGVKLFKLNDISYLDRLKKDPIYIYEKKDLHKTALDVRTKRTGTE